MTTATHRSNSPQRTPAYDAAKMRTAIRAIAVIVLAHAAVIFAISSIPNDRQDWIGNAPSVEERLNDRYVENIQYHRKIDSGDRRFRYVETVAIDGDVRTDCTVPNDTAPTLMCNIPVHLTPEP